MFKIIYIPDVQTRGADVIAILGLGYPFYLHRFSIKESMRKGPFKISAAGCIFLFADLFSQYYWKTPFFSSYNQCGALVLSGPAGQN